MNQKIKSISTKLFQIQKDYVEVNHEKGAKNPFVPHHNIKVGVWTSEVSYRDEHTLPIITKAIKLS